MEGYSEWNTKKYNIHLLMDEYTEEIAQMYFFSSIFSPVNMYIDCKKK